jgi:hypothetical protein
MKLQYLIIALLAILAIVFGVIWQNASKSNKELIKTNEELQELYEKLHCYHRRNPIQPGIS